MPITKGIAALADDLVESGVVLIRHNMSDGEYTDLIASADIVLIPYRIRPFRTRTSGVVLDALMAGKPVVTVRGTWAGDVIERYGAGVTYNDGDVKEMRTALEQVVTRLSLYDERMPSVQKEVTSEFAPDRLVSFLVNQAGMSTEPPSDRIVEEVVGWAERLRDLFQWRTKTQESHLIDLAVFHDDRRRSHEGFKDQIEDLEKSIEWHRGAGNQEPASSPDLVQLVYPRAAGARLDESALVASLIDPKGVVSGRLVDVGAHHGSSLSHFLAKGWGIVAFEPDTRHYEYLTSKYGADERVRLDNRAVTSSSGEKRTLYVSDESTGVSTLSPFLDSHVEAGAVETVALRDVLDDLHVHVLKIDTEGLDLSVLEGYPWDTDTPDAIICEFEDRKTRLLGYSTSDLADYLMERGYQVWMSEWHPVIRYGQQHDWHRLVAYPCEPSTPEAWGNFIAFKKPRKDSDMAKALASSLRVQKPDSEAGGSTTIGPKPKTEPSIPAERRGRRQALLRSLRGPLRPVLATTSFLTLLSAGLAMIDEVRSALVSGAAAIATAAVAVLIVATRLERRSQG
jgi:FkbM family methyltransferase